MEPIGFLFSLMAGERAAKAAESIENKADQDGNYPNMVVGNAEQLLTDEAAVEDNAPYIFRKSAGGNRAKEKLVGATMAWNQLVQNGNFAATTGWGKDGANFSVASNICTMLATAQNGVVRQSIAFVSGHHYKVSAQIKLTTATTSVRLVIGGNFVTKNTEATTSWQTVELIYTANATGNNYVRIQDARASDWDNIQITNVICCDITACFGSAIADRAYAMEQNEAGSGIAWLKSYGFLTAPYYAYDAGSLESVCVSQKQTVGFNLWDEEWELGRYDPSDGQPIAGTNRIRSKNYIPVVPGESYYLFIDSPDVGVLFGNICWYGENKAFISANTNIVNTIVQAPNGAKYAHFSVTPEYGTTYKHNICVNISKTTGTPKNGDYVPSDIHTYAIDDTKELRGLYKLDADNNLYADGDIMDGGTVTRKYALVDLGSLNWTVDNGIMYSNSISNLNTLDNNLVANILCEKYHAMAFTPLITKNNDKVIGANNSRRIYVYDSSYTDAATFTTAMSGVYLLYELGTPTTESCTKYDSPQVVDADGTEAFTDAKVAAGTRDVAVPVGHETKYLMDMRKKLEDLPPIPAAPSTDGTYQLIATVADGVATYSWEEVE